MADRFKYTPGPWAVGPLAGREDANGNDERVIERYNGGPVIATAWPMEGDIDRDDSPEREANARLLSKAPELHAVLADLFEHCNAAIEQAQRLLAYIDRGETA